MVAAGILALLIPIRPVRQAAGILFAIVRRRNYTRSPRSVLAHVRELIVRSPSMILSQSPFGRVEATMLKFIGPVYRCAMAVRGNWARTWFRKQDWRTSQSYEVSTAE